MAFEIQFDNPDAIEADEFLGLGSKKKKAEKKIKKAELAIRKGDLKKAEKKLAKADKKIFNAKGENVAIKDKITSLRDQVGITPAHVEESIAQQPMDNPTGGFVPIDPTSGQDGAAMPGSGSTALGGGGGGDMGYQGFPDEADYNQQFQDGTNIPSTATLPINGQDDDGTPIASKKGLIILIVVIVLAVAGYFIYKSQKHK